MLSCLLFFGGFLSIKLNASPAGLTGPPESRQTLSEPDLHVVIWGENRTEFGTSEADYKGKHVCVTGKIADYKGVPEIVATKLSQIKVD
jgi:hypothetical protein